MTCFAFALGATENEHSIVPSFHSVSALATTWKVGVLILLQPKNTRAINRKRKLNRSASNRSSALSVSPCAIPHAIRHGATLDSFRLQQVGCSLRSIEGKLNLLFFPTQPLLYLLCVCSSYKYQTTPAGPIFFPFFFYSIPQPLPSQPPIPLFFTMKITAAAALVASMAAVASADMLAISNPTKGSVWAVGDSVFLMWSGNCASMGAASKNVTVDFVQGPSGQVHFVNSLGLIDCSGSNVRSDYTVPTLTPGLYSIRVNTVPQPSYTNEFQINGAGGVAPPPSAAPQASATTAPSNPKPTGNAAGSLTANVMLAVAGAVAVASQMF